MYKLIQKCGVSPIRGSVFGATLSIALIVGCAPAVATDAVNTGYFGGVAILGYDPVAYFTEGRAMKGSEQFSYDWLGTPWQFANNKHRELFIGDPTKYAPQYGGYCVGEVASNGATINIDPEAWAIIDGRLYLSYSKEFMDKFEAQPSDFLANAEANWPAVETHLRQDGFQ
jgi:YHS domain-containing protein